MQTKEKSKKQRRLVLIESDWNLKVLLFVVSVISALGINRIRLEFKGSLKDVDKLLKLEY